MPEKLQKNYSSDSCSMIFATIVENNGKNINKFVRVAEDLLKT